MAAKPDKANRKKQAPKKRGRPFVKGDPRANVKGRPKGVPNKASREVKEIARRLVEDPGYVAALGERLVEGKAGAIEPLLWHYAYGKPKETIEVKDTAPRAAVDAALRAAAAAYVTRVAKADAVDDGG